MKNLFFIILLFPLLSFSQNDSISSKIEKKSEIETIYQNHFAIVDIEVIDSSFCEVKFRNKKVMLVKLIAVEWVNPASIRGNKDSSNYINDIYNIKYLLTNKDSVFERGRYRIPISTAHHHIPYLYTYGRIKSACRYDINKKYKYKPLYMVNTLHGERPVNLRIESNRFIFFLYDKGIISEKTYYKLAVFSTKEEKKIKKAIKKRNKEIEKGK